MPLPETLPMATRLRQLAELADYQRGDAEQLVMSTSARQEFVTLLRSLARDAIRGERDVPEDILAAILPDQASRDGSLPAAIDRQLHRWGMDYVTHGPVLNRQEDVVTDGLIAMARWVSGALERPSQAPAIPDGGILLTLEDIDEGTQNWEARVSQEPRGTVTVDLFSPTDPEGEPLTVAVAISDGRPRVLLYRNEAGENEASVYLSRQHGILVESGCWYPGRTPHNGLLINEKKIQLLTIPETLGMKNRIAVEYSVSSRDVSEWDQVLEP